MTAEILSLAAEGEALDAVAVVGMAGRFPGAQDVEELWRNLRGGVESIRFFTPEELIGAGVAPELVARPDFVPAMGMLEDGEWFDAGFFNLNRGQAEVLDPQHRLFLECAVAALEDAGYDPAAYPGSIGLYGGASWTTYLSRNLMARAEIRETLGIYQLVMANDKDFLATRVAYHLNLRGPCLTVQTACSTSLVAVHLACQALLGGECDLALAGGVSMSWPRPRGYLYQEGGILSPDGHCRAFDARARGTVGGQGVGIVVLKRLAAARDDGDAIRAILRGSAVNNDGAAKAGFTAPSIERQREVIKEALGIAGVSAATVSYVEAHGTGTELGDPIEVAALTEAFRATTDAVAFCALGSMKSNIGHLDAAAGIAGLIKVVLALEHGEIPPSLHFEAPNPRIDFAHSPFYVNARLSPWPRGATPRRAGVSALGIGGTNVHVVVEEAPPRPGPSVPPAPAARPWQLLTLSARSAPALERATARLARHLRRHAHLPLADVAYTLRVGRRDFEHRRFAVCRDAADGAEILTTPGSPRAAAGRPGEGAPAVVFLFPGQGAQHVDMGRELYAQEALFRREVDRCAAILAPEMGCDLRQLLYPRTAADGAERLERTDVAQPALFVVEYALARLWQSWGIEPRAMLGHSIGEYVAACLSGVFRLEDALRLVAARGRLLAALPGGAMLAVPLPPAEVTALLAPGLDLAAVNAPSRSVVAGAEREIAVLEARLAARGVVSRRLRTSHAFHSVAVEPAMAALAEQVARVERRLPEIPFLSNVTGTWITAAEATDPDYWGRRHLRLPVRFADGLAELARQIPRVLLEVGPGKTLTSLARQQGEGAAGVSVVASLPRPYPAGSEVAALLAAAGQLWLAGLPLDGTALHAGEPRRRVPLPTYPFERRPYWIEPPEPAAAPGEDRDRRLSGESCEPAIEPRRIAHVVP
ncbi:MAG TPA: type I polyketide synthase [Thermoanaerobaculia bacterium]|nr:type I polyketide synthase [Thermoanaerobaculia bacterium]